MVPTALDYRTAAAYLGCSVAALRRWKRLGNGPCYYTCGKLVRYRREDLDKWIQSRMCETSSR